VYLAIQLLGGAGASFDVPEAFPGVRAPDSQAPIPASQDPEKDLRDFTAYVFTNAQDFWRQTFQKAGRPYENAKLVLFRSGVSTGCGSASSSVGPFYCPADRRVYIDLSFYDDLSRQLGAPGDFAWAYVIAHEVGHHVQKVTGTSDEVQTLRAQDPEQSNELSVRLELQADCYAGVWAQSVFEAGDLETGDVEEAFAAAEAVGDDRLQRRARGEVDPDTFTHGTSEQRRKWFDIGRGGRPEDCDTFAADQV
jgi:predicted metalloprotease